MRNTAEHIETLYNKMKDYTETSVKLYKLQAIDVMGDIVSDVVIRVVFIFVLAMFLFFFNIGMGFYLGKTLDSYYLGFMIISSFYLLLGFVTYAMRYQLIKNPINDLIISKFQSEENKFDNPKKNMPNEEV